MPGTTKIDCVAQLAAAEIIHQMGGLSLDPDVLGLCNACMHSLRVPTVDISLSAARARSLTHTHRYIGQTPRMLAEANGHMNIVALIDSPPADEGEEEK